MRMTNNTMNHQTIVRLLKKILCYEGLCWADDMVELDSINYKRISAMLCCSRMYTFTIKGTKINKNIFPSKAGGSSCGSNYMVVTVDNNELTVVLKNKSEFNKEIDILSAIPSTTKVKRLKPGT
jgi:hypothetical protein